MPDNPQPQQSEPPAPEAVAAESPCPKCGAALKLTPGANVLSCQYCGHQQKLLLQGAEVIEWDLEFSLAYGLGASAIRDWSSRKTARCSNCGAAFNLPPHQQLARCEYCLSAQLVRADLAANVLAPDTMRPFGITPEQARARFATWLEGQTAAPASFRQDLQVKDVHGVYVPFWLLDCEVAVTWSATRASLPGSARPARSAVHRYKLDDYAVCASLPLRQAHLGAARAMSLRPASGLVPVDERLFAGCTLESYSVDLATAWQEARSWFVHDAVKRCYEAEAREAVRDVRTTTVLGRRAYRLILLPAYLFTVRYDEREFTIVMDGRDGQVYSSPPVSVVATTLQVLNALAIAALVVALFTGMAFALVMCAG